MSRVLVTGASGFIGTPVLRALADGGHEVHATARRPPPDPGPATWHQADLLKPGAAATLVPRVSPEAVLHLAWCATPGSYLTSADNLAWVAASIELLLACDAAGCRRSVLVGTCLEYEATDEPVHEQRTPLAPATPYAAAKHGLHVAAGAWAREAGHSLAWARVFHLFGPGEPRGRLVPTVVEAALGGGRAALSAGTQVRDFLEVDEVASALAALVASKVTGPVNVASGTGTSVADLAAMVAVAAGAPGCVELGAVETPDADRSRLVADTTRLSEEVGWRPQRTLAASVERTVGWWAARKTG